MVASDLQTAADLHKTGQLPEAEQLCRNILDREPENAEAFKLLGLFAFHRGRYAMSVTLIRKAIALGCTTADTHCNLGAALAGLRKFRQAVECLREAVRLAPELPEAHSNLGAALRRVGKLDEAEASLREALGLRPDYAKPRHELARVLHKKNRLGEAIDEYRKAIALRENWPDAHSGLVAALHATANVNEALAEQRRVVTLRPDSPQAVTLLLFLRHYDQSATAPRIFEEHLQWAEKFAEPFYSAIRPHQNDRDPNRRLRIGYISSDFRAHPITLFIEPALERHNRERFDVFLYANQIKEDMVTERLKALGHIWRDIRPLSDDEVAQQIREDRIDVLIELMGHLDGHRLLIFARKPAPIQVTYLAYPDTIGMKTIDYRITDSLHDPIGATEQFHAEQLIRLDPCAWCYRPSQPTPDFNESPALASGHITFANLNRLIKTTPAMIRLWARILAAVPNSKLMILAGAHGAKEPLIKQLFTNNGIPDHRLILMGRVPRRKYLTQYHQVDIALDVFPYNGHTTTLDALWMGVPVVSLIGDTHVQRAGLSVLTNIGLPELVARTAEEYVEKAVGLAEDWPRLAELRRTLRERMLRSPLMDEEGFTRRLEGAYRGMWERWVRLSAEG
jgi:predicted O-linked N-acetylglucosamine transferase (SPINDLY family)